MAKMTDSTLRAAVQKRASRAVAANTTVDAERKKALFDNNNAVAEAERQAEEYVEAVKVAKEHVKATNEFAQLEAEMKDLNSELKDYGETVNGHLFEYSRMTGQNEIVDEEGKTLKIKHQVQVKQGQMRLF